MRQVVLGLLMAAVLLASCGGKSGRRDFTLTQYEQAYDYYVKVVDVSDGDTFRGVTDQKKEIRFRIYGIDAPERKQPFSNKSKGYLSELIYGEKVGIKVQRKGDGYGRPVVWVYTPEGKDVGAEMLKAGLVWHFKEYDNSEEYANLEDSARKNKIGLWSDNKPVAPWDYRKGF